MQHDHECVMISPELNATRGPQTRSIASRPGELGQALHRKECEKQLPNIHAARP